MDSRSPKRASRAGRIAQQTQIRRSIEKARTVVSAACLTPEVGAGRHRTQPDSLLFPTPSYGAALSQSATSSLPGGAPGEQHEEGFETETPMPSKH